MNHDCGFILNILLSQLKSLSVSFLSFQRLNQVVKLLNSKKLELFCKARKRFLSRRPKVKKRLFVDPEFAGHVILQKLDETSIKTKRFSRDFHGNNRIFSKCVRNVGGGLERWSDSMGNSALGNLVHLC